VVGVPIGANTGPSGGVLGAWCGGFDPAVSAIIMPIASNNPSAQMMTTLIGAMRFWCSPRGNYLSFIML